MSALGFITLYQALSMLCLFSVHQLKLSLPRCQIHCKKDSKLSTSGLISAPELWRQLPLDESDSNSSPMSGALHFHLK